MPVAQVISNRRAGFTIVELLIVIVVIGILAAITIVAYNGVQKRATVTSLISDLANASKRLKLDQVDLGSYPATVALAGSGGGLKSSANTTYQYTVNNSSPQTFCLTATSGAISYFINQDNTPTIGGCAGHGTGGIAAITNMVANPSFESGNLTGYGFNSVGVSGSATVVNNSSLNGTKILNRSITSTTSAAGLGPYIQVGDISPTESFYTLSAWIRTSKPIDYRITAERRDSSAVSIGTIASNLVTVPANTWTRLTLQVPTLPNIDRLTFCVYSGTTSWVAGDWVDYDGLMVTKGSDTPTYADGNSSNWVWNGATNGSTSTGPSL